MQMDLTRLLLAGSLSGLTSVLAHSVAWSIAQLWKPGLRPEISQAQPNVAEVLLHMVCGIALGFLFWLSWGLAALVAVPWWARGAAFGLICWMSLSLPTALSHAGRGGDRLAAALISSRWASTALITGLACARTWELAS